jgi:hypothetical protein
MKKPQKFNGGDIAPQDGLYYLCTKNGKTKKGVRLAKGQRVPPAPAVTDYYSLNS